MAVTLLTGFDGGGPELDGFQPVGGASYSTAQARTGRGSLRANPPSGNTGYGLSAASVQGWVHFGLYIATLPSVSRGIVFNGSAVALSLGATGRITATGGAFHSTLTTGTWYWIGLRFVAGSFTGVWLQVDGVNGASFNNTAPAASNLILGANDSPAATYDVYFDDVIVDNTGFLAPSKVIDLLPTADSAIGTGWTLGSGGTTNLWGGVDNQPPTAVADPGTTAQIRNAASAVSNYDATLQTYTVGGAGTGATVLAVQPVVATGAPVATSAKLGTVGMVSNPAITNIALGAGGTAGAFHGGTAGTYPTGWKVSQGTLTTSPSVTLGTAPVMRVTQSTASTRIAMVGYMALRVAWTPSAATPVTGTGAGAGTAATSAGTAAETMSGTGAGTGTAATASGTGDVTAAGATGTGAGTQAAQTALGTGVETISGTGAGMLPPPAAAGSGTSLLAVTGTGAGTGTASSADGAGTSLLAATGTGAGTGTAPSAAGSGDVAALGEITGTGAGVQVPQSGSGAGTVEGGVEVPPTVEGSTIFAPKLRVISGSGGGVQARQSAKGRGTVNDDDLVVLAA